MPEKVDRHAQRRSRSIQSLETAALGLLKSKSYSAIRVEDITTRAGLSKGSLYLYFRDKGDLFQKALRSRLFEPMEQYLDRLMGRGSPRDILAELITYSIERAPLELDMETIYRSVMDKTLVELLYEDLERFDNKFFGAGESLFVALGAKEPWLRTLILFAMLDGLGIYRCLMVGGPEFWQQPDATRSLSETVLDLFGLKDKPAETGKGK